MSDIRDKIKPGSPLTASQVLRLKAIEVRQFAMHHFREAERLRLELSEAERGAERCNVSAEKYDAAAAKLEAEGL